MRKAKKRIQKRNSILFGIISGFALMFMGLIMLGGGVDVISLFSGGVGIAILLPVAIMEFKEKTAEQIEQMTAEEKTNYNAKKVANMVLNIQKSVTDLKNGSISKKEYKTLKADLKTEIKKEFEGKELSDLKNSLTELTEKHIDLELNVKNTNVEKTQKGGFKTFLTNFLQKDDIVAYRNKPNGRTDEVSTKTVSLENDYTGAINLTQQSGIVTSAPERPLNMRDIMSVEQTDMTFVEYQEITDFVTSIDMESENSDINESSFKFIERNAGVKRLGTFITLSKRMLKSTSYIVTRVMNILPLKMRFVEDFQILFGDGVGNNVLGLTKIARNYNVADVTFSAASIASISSYNSGTETIVTFASAHNLRNKYKIAFAATTNYNATYSFVVISATQILLKNATYSAQIPAAWTATATHVFKDNIVDANMFDALITAISDMKIDFYQATGVVMNPADVTLLKQIKSTTGQYLPVVETKRSTTFIDGLPIVENDGIGVGDFLLGDFKTAVSLVDYESLKLYFATDVAHMKANQVALIVDEELIMPVYNSMMFTYGNFKTVIDAIDKP